MTPDIERLFQPRLGDGAATALASDFARHPGPKHGVVVGGGPSSAVLVAAVDALGPDDSLTGWSRVRLPREVTSHIEDVGSWVEQRVRVVQTLAESTRRCAHRG
jgi:phosphatidylserine decarboxylase